MAAFCTAEDEKRALAASVTSTLDAESLTSDATAVRRRGAAVRHVVHCVLASLLVVSWCFLAYGVTSMATGSWRQTPSCHDSMAMPRPIVPAAHPLRPAVGHHRSHQHAHDIADLSEGSDGSAAPFAGPADGPLADVHTLDDDTPNAADSSPSSFARLLEAVSPEALHQLLHAYLPDTYKHGVYPSEQSALAALHRANAPLASSIVHMARRDANATVSSAALTTTPGAVATTTTAGETTKAAATTATIPTTATTAAPTATTDAGQTTTADADTTASSHKITSTYTTTINGTPTVVTATTVVGVAETDTSSSETAAASGTAAASASLQTGAAAADRVNLRLAVAGLLVGALLV